MIWFRFISASFWLASVLCGAVQAAPLLESVSPLSCQTCGQVTVKLNGNGLEDVDALVFSIPGATAKQDADGFVSNRDDHSVNADNFKACRERMPVLDQCVPALINDLHDRGLNKNVLFIQRTACSNPDRWRANRRTALIL